MITARSKKLYITGMGIVSAIGLDTTETLASLRAGKTGIGALTYLKTTHREFPVGEVKLSTEEMRKRMQIPDNQPATRTSLMGMMALEQALRQAHLTSDEMTQTAFVSGTTVGGMDMSEQFYPDFLENEQHKEYISQHDCGACTESIADHFGRFASVTTLSTACSSAANAIINGANLLRSGQREIAVVGGSECITMFHLNGFNSLMILDHEICRPFDATRAGLNLGEGAAFLVIETEESAQRRGAQPLAVLEGYGNACDAFHQTASSPDGGGSYLAMREALADAGLQPADIDYINAHGTGTPNNDTSESQAMMRLFGEALPPVSSTKSFTGHTTSASGSIETVICLLAMQEQFLPLNLGWQHQMEDGITPVTSQTPQRPLRHVLCNSFGFGGNDSSLVLGGLTPDPSPVGEGRMGNQDKVLAYITAAEQISIQEPLSEQWLQEPLLHEEPYVRSLDPDFKQWLSAGESRRMGKLMKRALATSLTAMQKSGVEHPDAIITGTGLGCIENTEILLSHLCFEGEENCKPTPFMQSTHNTISSLVSIHTKCHGYNATYAHKEASFDGALEDAWTQMQLGRIQTALVGGQDEMTPNYFKMLCKTGFFGNPRQVAGETAVSIMLNREQTHTALCRITAVKRMYQPTAAELKAEAEALGAVDAVMTSVAGTANTKAVAQAADLFPDTPLLQFKNLFGDGYTSFGLGVYATAHILHRQQLPDVMLVEGSHKPQSLHRLLLLNDINGKDYTFVLLESL
ncbi:MAG: beta-ketoacyl-[Bacteroidaceae bacterium]|nr:beta-ketoacyl-[acyl-carrier-protein] synthase family protein [Bacteroidaceae bacterium]